VIATQKIRADIVDTRVTDQMGARLIGRMASGMAAHWAGDASAAGLLGRGDFVVDLAGDVHRVQIAYAAPDDPYWLGVPMASGEPEPAPEPEPTPPTPTHPSQEPRPMPDSVAAWIHAFAAFHGRMPGVGKIAAYTRKHHGSCSVDVAQRWQGEMEALLFGGKECVILRPDWTRGRDENTPNTPNHGRIAT
jgi:hypothetical protein